jgi:hypothetical protein
MMSGVTVQDNFFPSSSGLIPRNWDNWSDFLYLIKAYN